MVYQFKTVQCRKKGGGQGGREKKEEEANNNNENHQNKAIQKQQLFTVCECVSFHLHVTHFFFVFLCLFSGIEETYFADQEPARIENTHKKYFFCKNMNRTTKWNLHMKTVFTFPVLRDQIVPY